MKIQDVRRGTFASQSLDMIRGLSALLVLLGHARNLLLVDFSELHNPSVAVKGLYFVTGFGHECVIAFFVLSGLFIGTSVLQRISTRSWSLSDYLVNRWSRLYLVLIPALALTWSCDQLGLRMAGPDSIYHGVGPQTVIRDVPLHSTARVLAGNVFFTQTILVPTFGSNGPLWSLSNEFWYYMLFPCMLIAGSRGFPSRQRLAYLVAFLLMSAFSQPLLPLFPLWLLGAALGKMPQCGWLRRSTVLKASTSLALGILCMVLVAIRTKQISDHRLSEYCLGVAVAGLIYCLLHCATPARATALWRLSDALALMSYTLYLVHMPILMLIAGGLRGGARVVPTIGNISTYLGICGIVVAVSWGIAQCTESHTEGFRRLIRRTLLGRVLPVDRPLTAETIREAPKSTRADSAAVELATDGER